jgi:formylglycine-generating enzyme required for sulfatase activity
MTAAAAALLPAPAKAGEWKDDLAAKVREGLAGARGKIEALRKKAGPEGLPAIDKQAAEVDRLEAEARRLDEHRKSFAAALTAWEERRLGDLEAALGKIPEPGNADPRVEKLAAARKAMAAAFDAVFRTLDLDRARVSFEEAAAACSEVVPAGTPSWPRACLERLDALKKATASMGPVTGGGAKIQEAAPKAVECFFIDCDEVSVAEYRKFIDFLAKAKSFAEVKDLWPDEDTFERCRGAPDSFERKDADSSWPAEGVNYWQALAYVRWKGKDLMRFEEWWLAAKGRYEDGHRQYPSLLSEINRSGRPVRVNSGPGARGSRPLLPVHHLSGNAAEWTLVEKGARTARVVGGSYRDSDEKLFSGERWVTMELLDTRLGFGFRGVLRPREFFAAQSPRG